MWIFTTTGYFSVVEHYDDPNTLLIRSRVGEDLERLRARFPLVSEMEHTPDADYSYRATVKRSDFANMISRLVLEIDYPNFKNAACGPGDHLRSHAYMDCWTALRHWQERSTS